MPAMRVSRIAALSLIQIPRTRMNAGFHLFRAVVLMLAAGLSSLSMAADRADVLELELRLIGALGTGGESALPALLLDLTRTGDRWEQVWGCHSDNRKPSLFRGRVRQAQVNGQGVTLLVQFRQKELDSVEVKMRRLPGDRLEGTYTVNRGSDVIKGRADGRIKPQRSLLPPGVVPARPGEHPRILLRATDVPALKEKLKTPWGKAIFDRMGDEKTADAIGQGLKYVLTGEPQYAEKAREFVERNMAGNPGGYSMRSSAGRIPEQIALAYDLCYHAWPEDFRTKVKEHLVKEGERFLSGRGFSGGYNWHVSSNWGAKVYQGAGLMGLALWGETGPPPPKPAGTDAARLADWEEDLADWNRLGGCDLPCQRIFEESRYLLYLHNREAIGTGGFRGECSHYGLNAMEMQLEYAACYRRMFGHDLSPYPDATHAMPRMMFCHYFPDDTKSRAVPLGINGLSDLRPNMLAYAWPLAPEAWRGAYSWIWNRSTGIAAAENLSDAKKRLELTGSDAAWLLLSYPLGAKPQPPAEAMPLTWQAPDHGFYGFRNSWKGQGDFVLLVHAKTHSPGGWNGPNTGTFHLYGLGQSWNGTYDGREVCAWEENRVLLPEDPFFDAGLGRVVHAAVQPDGSGSVSIDISDMYNVAVGRPYSMYGNVRNDAAFKDGRIRALRALAVDYSGRSGAPCLFVLVDRISGGKSKLWTWNLGDPAVVPKVAIAGDSFTLPRGNGVMRGTFVAPRAVQISARVNDGKDQPGHNCGSREKTPPRPVPTLFAQGGDDFFLVATIQDTNAPPPEVKRSGEGLDSTVIVGKRRVSFHDDRIVIVDGP